MAGALLALSAVGPAPAAALPRPVRYVAMGDSAASAAGVPPQTDLPCLRSGNNYPHLLARALRPAAFTDVTCSGAEAAAPDSQLGALSPDTTLVTLTIGANDAGFSDAIQRCTLLGLLNPHGAPCRASYRQGGQDEIRHAAETAGERTAAELSAVHHRAPHARVLLVGYLKVFPDHGSCRPRETLADGDLGYLAHAENHLNAVLAHVARAAGAEFVDLHPVSTGHDICAPDGVRWSEALLPTRPTVPFHPNLAGERAMAREVLARL